MLLLLLLLPSVPPLRGRRIHVHRDAKRPTTGAVSLLFRLLHELLERTSNLLLLASLYAIDEKLGLPIEQEVVKRTDNAIEAPVAWIGLDLPRGWMLNFHQLS